MTDFSTTIRCKCPHCGRPYLREEGPLCDCQEEHCEHIYLHVGLTPTVPFTVHDWSPQEFIKVFVYCDKCGKPAVEVYEYKGLEEP